MDVDLRQDDELDLQPVIHVISDSLGDTASDVVAAAASQFDEGAVEIERLSKVTTVEQVRRYFDENAVPGAPTAAFHTIVVPDLRAEIRSELDRRGIPSIDLMGPAITVISALTGAEPRNIAGAIHDFNDKAYRRSDAMQFFVSHDDNRNPQDLPEADVIIAGISRTSKTPIATYLAFMGLKVAVIALRPDRALPDELEACDKTRIFGLVSPTEKLMELRRRRLYEDETIPAVYATEDFIANEQAFSAEVFEHLGCNVIDTEGMAVEEVAAEILQRIGRV